MRQPSELPPTPDGDPAEGRPDLKMPGADQPSSADLPYTDGDEPRPDPTLQRSPGINPNEPDLQPDVDVPEETM